jgi:hypothetical protein
LKSRASAACRMPRTAPPAEATPSHGRS